MTPPIASLSSLRPWLDERGLRRIVLLTGPERRYVELVSPHLSGLDVSVFDGSAPHVPESTVRAAMDFTNEASPDALISLGGGSATGLGKALRLKLDLPFVAIATTYAGSECTSIYGIQRDGEKQTGRSERVRPDLVVHEVALTRSMPRRLTTTSLMNALAHPLSGLSTGELDEETTRKALDAIKVLVGAAKTLVGKPTHRGARAEALAGVAAAAQVLDAGTLGEHHRVAHHFGGRTSASHAELHAALLPHTTAALIHRDPDLGDRIHRAARTPDLPGLLFTWLRRVQAPTALRAMAEPSVIRSATADLESLNLQDATRAAAAEAVQGRDPSARFDAVDLGDGLAASAIAPNGLARRAVVALHGRGSTAESILAEARAVTGDAPDVWLLAPQADNNSWYNAGYAEALDAAAEEVDSALGVVDAAVQRAAEEVGRENVVVMGFSQGACLASEWAIRTESPVGGLVILTGAPLGPRPAPRTPASFWNGVPAVVGIQRDDPWVRPEHAESFAETLRAAGAESTFLMAEPGPHRIRSLERIEARRVILGEYGPEPSRGFGNAHQLETLVGALPRDQNSPRRGPYGLYPEQINGTGFVAPRSHNLRAWLYKVRPAAQHTPFVKLDHPRLVGTFDGAPEPNLSGWKAPALPDEPQDFVDGLTTVGGAGSAATRRGWAAHLYTANQSMEDRAFYNADGDLLLVPQHGRLTVQTEMGLLELPPGHVAVVPRGLRFSVLLPDGPARGYVGEIFGRHWELPERGPVGSNGLTDPRHFETPVPWHEDRVQPGYRITARFGGELFEATQDYSPYDAAAWHGTLTPYRYDLMNFAPVGPTRFDHPDPSIYTVLSAPMDEPGSHNLDFVFFPPRWDVSEHTFRPPYFHRNATTEFNGIVADPSLSPDGPFEPGGAFLTPGMTAHGVVARGVERAFETSSQTADRPHRVGQRSMWFQFESALPLVLTPWARDGAARVEDWADIWGTYEDHYTPRDAAGPWK